MNFFATLAKGLFSPETWKRCDKHNIPFPNGAKCPKCVACTTDTKGDCNTNSSR